MPRGGAEYEQHSDLSSQINELELAQMQDRWYWSLMGIGIFSVKSVRNFIDDFMLVSDEVPTRWVKMIPIKVNVFAWRVRMDKLLTRLNLSLRGMDIPSILCPICDLEVESISHLLFSCSMARDILSKVFQWWSLDSTSFLSYEDWLSWFIDIHTSKQVKSVLEGVFYVTWWQIWRFRNNLLFGLTVPRKATIFDDIITLAYTWCSNRCKSKLNWRNGMQYPMSAIM
ncbi:RNA-directed DNA polymerase, eukaryota [Tanacetum coccineum]